MKEANNGKGYGGLAAVLLVVCCVACGGNTSQDKVVVTGADTTATQVAPPVLTAGMEAGKVVYEQNCVTCHQVNGKGVSGLNPPLAGTEYVNGDQDRLIGIVLNGSNVGLDVNGMVYNNTMPAHAFLSDEEVAHVLSYVRNSFGNQADTIAAEAVAKVRASL